MHRLLSSPLVFLTFVALVSSCGSLRPTAESTYYLGKLRIEKAKNLSPQEREVEARFATYLEEHTEEAIALYGGKFGKEITADNVKEMSEDFAPGGIDATDARTKAARSIWSAAVHEPSRGLAREIYLRQLKKPAGANQLNHVVFTAGGIGAGKTTAIRSMPQIVNVAERAQIIYDTTLSTLRSAVERISQALEAGKTVSIVFVYRDPVESLVAGALPRAEETGRTAPLEAFLETHMGASRVVLQIAERYKADPRVAISVIDNSGGMGRAIVTDVEFARRSASKYTPEDLRAKLVKALEDAYEKGKRGEQDGISEAVYRGFKGHVR